MAAVRTSRFAAGSTNLTSEVTIYTVPSGKRALVRGVNYVNNRSGASVGYLGVRAPGGALVGVDESSSVPSFGGVRFDPWMVANAGDSLTITAPSGSGDFFFTVAGVLFDLP